MNFTIFPAKVDFFELFDKQTECLSAAGAFFEKWVSTGTLDTALIQKMHDIEHDGDRATYAIIDQLNKSFITPFDREDIHELAKATDDIIDLLRTIVNRMRVYQLSGVDQHLVDFGRAINESITSLASAVRGLRNSKLSRDIVKSCANINRLEKEGDHMRDIALADLFENNKEPLSVIKLKEIYEDAETVLDICKDVAHIVEAILVKQA
jgi:uncharacterized protein